jgi:hypothetical protein
MMASSDMTGVDLVGLRYIPAFRFSTPSQLFVIPISSTEGTNLGGGAGAGVGVEKSGKSRDTDSSSGSFVSPIVAWFIKRSAPNTSLIYVFQRSSSENYNALKL